MGKLVLVSGANGSGKSAFAEKLLSRCDCKRYYIATMIPETKNNYERIEKHKKQREGLGFTTLELPYDLSGQNIGYDSVVLLEDVSNLFANNVFDKNKSPQDVFCDIMGLKERCKLVVAVTISGLEDNGYDEETSAYISGVNEINRKLYDESSVAVVMKDGNPVYEKGDEYDVC